MKHLNQSGFTMLEVLIAMIILAIGLLGLAGLQANSMRFNNSAYLRSQASYLATDIADKIRANHTALEAGTFDDINTDNTYSINDCYYSSTGNCSSSNLATSAIGDWKALLQKVLPSGSATVTKNADDIYTVAITWVDNTTDAVDKTRSFSTSFAP